MGLFRGLGTVQPFAKCLAGSSVSLEVSTSPSSEALPYKMSVKNQKVSTQIQPGLDSGCLKSSQRRLLPQKNTRTFQTHPVASHTHSPIDLPSGSVANSERKSHKEFQA